jgi:hypothetical protein
MRQLLDRDDYDIETSIFDDSNSFVNCSFLLSFLCCFYLCQICVPCNSYKSTIRKTQITCIMISLNIHHRYNTIKH